MATIKALRDKYEGLDRNISAVGQEAVDSSILLVFDYEFPNQPCEIAIETEEFTALCPWTGLPDYGSLNITYTPSDKCIELKSLKYYLLSYRDVGIVQEHAANLILRDLVAHCGPRYMKVALDYKVRGGLHTTVTIEHRPTPVQSQTPGLG